MSEQRWNDERFDLAIEQQRSAFADLQQARCPEHNLPLNGFGLCPNTLTSGCGWSAKQSMGMKSAPVSKVALEQFQNQYNAAVPPEPISYFEADRNHWRDKFNRTQGIRGALRNLWRQAWR